jgi:hypothetical protein
MCISLPVNGKWPQQQYNTLGVNLHPIATIARQIGTVIGGHNEQDRGRQGRSRSYITKWQCVIEPEVSVLSAFDLLYGC